MAFLIDNIFDSGLSYAVTNGSRVDICSAEPTNYTLATSTNTLGNKTGLTLGAIEAGATDGRRTIIPAITDGSVTGTASATHWALTDGASILIATGAITTPQTVTSGNTFTLDAISLTLRDAT